VNERDEVCCVVLVYVVRNKKGRSDIRQVGKALTTKEQQT